MSVALVLCAWALWASIGGIRGLPSLLHLIGIGTSRQAPVLGWGALAQAALSAVLFGLVHGVWGLFARNVRVAVGSMIATGLLGAALAVVYLASDRVIAPCIWAHAGINLVIEPWLLLAAMSRGKVAAAPVTAAA